MRTVIEPTFNEDGAETHPAFGVVVLNRTSGTARALFQSDIQHQHTVSLELHTATRRRDLGRDWTHARESIVRIEMSEAQWASLISSVGQGSGTPVTIRRRDGVSLPDLPFRTRVATNIDEVHATTKRLLEDVAAATAAVEAAVESKAGIRELRKAVTNLHFAVANAPANAAFAVTALHEAVEQTVQHARADIEMHVMNAQASLPAGYTLEGTGLDAIDAAPSPTQDVPTTD